MGSVPRKQQQNPFVEKVVVQSAPMEDTKHGERVIVCPYEEAK